MRVFVPCTMTGLRRLHERGGLTDPPTFGSAVTPYLRNYYSAADQEELEYLILTAAAHDSLRLLSGDSSEVRRRVVVAIDVAESAVIPDPAAGPTAVRVSVEVPLRDILAVHVDGDEAVETIRAATAVSDAADRGEAGASEVIEAVDEHELLWYGVQEIGDLVRA